MNHTHLFTVVDTGPATWEVRHEVTFELAGIIRRTPSGFALKDHAANPIGVFGTIDGAIEGLYELS